nr:MAG TPA: hypothetical protein [Ackermannviridae sp.]
MLGISLLGFEEVKSRKSVSICSVDKLLFNGTILNNVVSESTEIPKNINFTLCLELIPRLKNETQISQPIKLSSLDT